MASLLIMTCGRDCGPPLMPNVNYTHTHNDAIDGTEADVEGRIETRGGRDNEGFEHDKDNNEDGNYNIDI